MCTQREILQNDLLRSAKLGPWQKEKQQLKMGVLFYFSVFSVVFPYVRFSFFYQTRKGALSFPTTDTNVIDLPKLRFQQPQEMVVQLEMLLICR